MRNKREWETSLKILHQQCVIPTTKKKTASLILDDSLPSAWNDSEMLCAWTYLKPSTQSKHTSRQVGIGIMSNQNFIYDSVILCQCTTATGRGCGCLLLSVTPPHHPPSHEDVCTCLRMGVLVAPLLLTVFGPKSSWVQREQSISLYTAAVGIFSFVLFCELDFPFYNATASNAK